MRENNTGKNYTCENKHVLPPNDYIIDLMNDGSPSLINKLNQIVLHGSANMTDSAEFKIWKQYAVNLSRLLGINSKRNNAERHYCAGYFKRDVESVIAKAKYDLETEEILYIVQNINCMKVLNLLEKNMFLTGDAIAARLEFSSDEFSSTFKQLEDRGLFQINNNYYQLTHKGRCFIHKILKSKGK